MSECRDCSKARTDPNWGGYRHQCDGCVVRTFANSPRHIREAHYERLKTAAGPDALAVFKAAVTAEWKRLRELRAGNSGMQGGAACSKS